MSLSLAPLHTAAASLGDLGVFAYLAPRNLTGDAPCPSSFVPDDDGPEHVDQQMADDGADADMLATPEMLTSLLERHVGVQPFDEQPVNLHRWRVATDGDVDALDLRGVLALLMSADDLGELRAAQHKLRAALRVEHADWLEARASDLMAGD